MTKVEQEVWDTVHRHLEGAFMQDVDAYLATTAEDLSLYEWFITPHRQDGLPFHPFPEIDIHIFQYAFQNKIGIPFPGFRIVFGYYNPQDF